MKRYDLRIIDRKTGKYYDVTTVRDAEEMANYIEGTENDVICTLQADAVQGAARKLRGVRF